jgi:hypothetical protein
VLIDSSPVEDEDDSSNLESPPPVKYTVPSIDGTACHCREEWPLDVVVVDTNGERNLFTVADDEVSSIVAADDDANVDAASSFCDRFHNTSPDDLDTPANVPSTLTRISTESCSSFVSAALAEIIGMVDATTNKVSSIYSNVSTFFGRCNFLLRDRRIFCGDMIA